MLRRLLISLFLTMVFVMLLGVVWLLGMRAKVPFVLDAVRGLATRRFNPRQMKTAGSPGAPAAWSTTARVISPISRSLRTANRLFPQVSSRALAPASM